MVILGAFSAAGEFPLLACEAAVSGSPQGICPFASCGWGRNFRVGARAVAYGIKN